MNQLKINDVKINIWNEFEERKNELFRFCNGKEICLWGYGYTGRFCEHLFLRENKQIEHIIDDAALDLKIDIERSFILEELDKDTHVVLLAFGREEGAVSFLVRLGFKENHNYIFIREWFYGVNSGDRKLSYYDWLEWKYGLDLTASVNLDEMEVPGQDSFYYSPGIDYSLVDVLDCFEFSSGKDAAFDFGCGKGGVLLLFHTAGVWNIGGVEYDHRLYQTALDNLLKLEIDSTGICHNDAAQITLELDKYNYFFMYNPFQGRTFERVIKNLEDSYQRQNRAMYLIYSGPYCHSIVIKNGIFKHAKTIKTDYAVKNVRIYSTNLSESNIDMHKQELKT